MEVAGQAGMRSSQNRFGSDWQRVWISTKYPDSGHGIRQMQTADLQPSTPVSLNSTPFSLKHSSTWLRLALNNCHGNTIYTKNSQVCRSAVCIVAHRSGRFESPQFTDFRSLCVDSEFIPLKDDWLAIDNKRSARAHKAKSRTWPESAFWDEIRVMWSKNTSAHC